MSRIAARLWVSLLTGWRKLKYTHRVQTVRGSSTTTYSAPYRVLKEYSMTIERLKWAAIISFIVSLGGLLIGGMFANREAPPYPGKVAGPDGATLFTKSDILAGQDVYQRYGLMDHGSVWGHGSQRGMEFSAVTLHLMGETVRKQVA